MSSPPSLHKVSAAGPATHTHGIRTDMDQKKLTVLETHGYYLGKSIGSGSYATVRVAHSQRHEGNVAIKIVSKFTAPADYLKKFLPREIEVVKGLKHPNLIRFLQAIETTHRVYIIMEYAENGSLLDIIRRDTYIDETRSRKWFKQLVDAIDYLHDRGVVHRDIKCENLLMDNGYNIKLSDFGFARAQAKDKTGLAQLSETFCGSYAYASPEILKGIPYQPQMSDVWSMGVVLYAMVYGRLPFDDTNYNLLIKQVTNRVTFPKEPKVSPTCRALINKILSPLKSRTRILGIRNDSWFCTAAGEKAGSSKEDSSESEVAAHSDRSEQETGKAPNLLTKEMLRGDVKDRRRRGSSTDEETPIALQMPEPDYRTNESNTISKYKNSRRPREE